MNYIGCLSGLYDITRHGKLFLKEELKSIRDDYAYWYDVVALEDKAYGNREILAKYRVLSNSTTGNKRKLIGKQYQFYRDYLKEAPFTAVVNVVRWGIVGIQKFDNIFLASCIKKCRPASCSIISVRPDSGPVRMASMTASRF